MPTYDYLCKSCGHRLEVFQSITEGPKRKCPECGARRLERQIGAGAAILFKGSGFYQTDYRSDSYRKGAEAEQPASTGEPKPAAAAGDSADKPGKKDTAKPEATKKKGKSGSGDASAA